MMKCHNRKGCGIAQIVRFDLLRNAESFLNSNIYKVIGNILIEIALKKHYSYYSEWGLSQHKTTKLMEE